MILNFSCLRSSVSFACFILGLAAVTPPVVHGQFLQGTIDGNIIARHSRNQMVMAFSVPV